MYGIALATHSLGKVSSKPWPPLVGASERRIGSKKKTRTFWLNHNVGDETLRSHVPADFGLAKPSDGLATVPVEADYFDIPGTEETGTSGSFFKNFTGNYVWVRAVVIYTDGTVQSILLNH